MKSSKTFKKNGCTKAVRKKLENDNNTTNGKYIKNYQNSLPFEIKYLKIRKKKTSD